MFSRTSFSRRSNTTRASLALLFTVAAAFTAVQPVAAQEDANVQRGFSAEKVYAFGEVDSVNLFNGNLVLTIPLGGTYPVSSSLSYNLVLTYNSNVWDMYGRSAGPYSYVFAQPSGLFNAGLGFTLTLGQLYSTSSPLNQTSRWMYLAEDGSQHGFYDTLHIGETATAGVSYTRDGSYLRMTILDPLSDTLRRVEFPDGTFKTYSRNGSEWRLISINDRFNHTVSISYPTTNLPQGVTSEWKITDGSRIHYLDFATMISDGQSVQYLSKVRLASAAGGTADYTFGYTARTVQRPCDDTDPLTDLDATVQTLSSVLLPDGSSWRPDDYFTTCTEGTGQLKRLILPTLGRLEWTYQDYTYPVRSAGVGGETLQLTTTKGVATKQALDANGSCTTWEGVACQWTYATSRSPGVSKNTVTYPTGHQTDFWFSQPFGLSTNGYTGWEYGLPFHPTTSDGQGRYLSQEIYSVSGAVRTKKRTVYLRYERDKVGSTTDPDLWYSTNRRPASEKTVFDDDGGKYAETTWSEFDGVGHYRKAVTSGSFGAGDVRSSYTGYNPETAIYDVVESTNTQVAGYNGFPASTNWVLDTFDQRWQEESSVRAVEQFCFENQSAANRNGLLLRHRVLAGATPGSNDLVTVYEAFPSSTADWGEVKKELHYGGDVQSVSTGALCTASFTGEQYRVDHTYDHGTRITSRWIDGAGVAMPFYTLQLTVEPNTGLPATSKDISGIQTTYTYDVQGRLTWEKPETGQGAWTSYVYTRATSASALANVLIVSRPNGSSTGSLAQSRVYFDGFGRVWRDQKLGADGTWSTVDTVWNSVGWKRSVTERQPVWPTQWTIYKDFDPFGRPTHIQPSDGAGHLVTLGYLGTRQVTRTVPVKLATGETGVTTTERYDRQGRLWQVVEPSGTGGANVTTTYGYDVGNRLKSVSIAGGTTQTRSFNYDLRGLLTWEQHPEKGPSGNGFVRYLNYDALGNPGRKVDAVATKTVTSGAASDLTFTYDRANRLTYVRDNQQASRILKQLTYGTGNSGSDKRLGRLWTADRYNYVKISSTDFIVRALETYAYAGVGGRTSSRTTQMYVNGGAQESFTQAWAWNDLGAPTTLTYPRCTHAACTGAAASSRSVTDSYTNGYLTSITGFASSISYHPNGMVNQIAYAVTGGSPALTYTQGLDPNGMRRPASYTVTSGATTLWSSGTYSYDGAGNVGAIGSSSFVYDGVSRLTSGSVNTKATGTASLKTQTVTYDAYGNILTKSAGGSPVDLATSPSTNRMTSAAVAYDSAGAMTAWNLNTYKYDAVGMPWEVVASGVTYVHMYTADDERIWTFQAGAPSRWTLRDLDGKVLRELKNNAGTWTVERDYVMRDGTALAAVTPTGTTFLHPDHLGTPRLITTSAGATSAFHAYYPFGEEATAVNLDAERMKFTGHERDLGILTSTADDLDYMHARFYNGQTGRFLSVDPDRAISPKRPQSWSRYTYVSSNPLRFFDPDGERQNPVTGARGVAPPAYGVQGAIRMSPTNPRVGRFGYTRDGGTKEHHGIDINATKGTQLRAPESGTIVGMNSGPQAGNRIDIKTAQGEVVMLAHLDNFTTSLSVGTMVTEGEIVGTAGTTGNQSDPGDADYDSQQEHVHMVVKDSKGRLIDPESWLNDPNAAAPLPNP